MVYVAMNLLDPDARGVHMSRLYQQLQDLTAASLHRLAALGRAA
ncbi:MAG TPA: hypothetical protein VNI56_01715 [Xanthomonadaceae bacterium]|nr:hypothetical protein [Xanthomonadaceae bacterium]